MVVYYFATRHSKYIALAVGFAFGSVVFLFSKISADFNPVATVIFVLEKKQSICDLITLVIPQLLAGLAVVESFKHIK
jgi:glycerol uptake facilitator-like aquaporin